VVHCGVELRQRGGAILIQECDHASAPPSHERPDLVVNVPRQRLGYQSFHLGAAAGNAMSTRRDDLGDRQHGPQPPAPSQLRAPLRRPQALIYPEAAAEVAGNLQIDIGRGGQRSLFDGDGPRLLHPIKDGPGDQVERAELVQCSQPPHRKRSVLGHGQLTGEDHPGLVDVTQPGHPTEHLQCLAPHRVLRAVDRRKGPLGQIDRAVGLTATELHLGGERIDVRRGGRLHTSGVRDLRSSKPPPAGGHRGPCQQNMHLLGTWIRVWQLVEEPFADVKGIVDPRGVGKGL
jgi:hypothetical protein